MNEKKEDPCHGCRYAGYWQGHDSYTCDYILIERHRRGCPAGKGCTKRDDGKNRRNSPVVYGRGKKLPEKKQTAQEESIPKQYDSSDIKRIVNSILSAERREVREAIRVILGGRA